MTKVDGTKGDVTETETESNEAFSRWRRVEYHSPTKNNSHILLSLVRNSKINYRNRNSNNSWLEGVRNNFSNRNSNNSVHGATGGAENTRWDTYRRQLCLRSNYRQFFGGWFSIVNGVRTLGSERLDVEALKKYPCLAACASLWRLPRLFGDDTHAVVAQPKWA